MRRLLSATAFALFYWWTLVPVASADCQGSQTNPADADRATESGGTASQHGTAALDCLKYVGSIEMHGVENVLIRDEGGTIHHLKVGDPMGENDGVISSIDNNTIYVKQHIRRGGKWHDSLVRFPKRAD